MPIRPAESLYVHTPYCVRKCPYCDFFKVARPDPAVATPKLPAGEAYLAALRAEAMARRHLAPAPRTVFIGGGTPSALTMDELRELMAILHDTFDLSKVVEWTVEANPNSLTREKAKLLADAGVTRMSIGVQSFDPSALAFLGRAHSADDVAPAVAAVREAGIGALSIDLISALGPAAGVREPERSLRDIDRALQLCEPLDHISVYTLIVEEGTPFHARAAAGEQLTPDDETAARCYATTTERIVAAGLRRYEISNYAREGSESRHNLAYWLCDPWLGLGPSAHSFDGRERRGNVRDLAAWVRAWQPGGDVHDAVSLVETLTPQQVLEERLLMGLRLADGIDFLAAAEAASEVDEAGRVEWNEVARKAPEVTQDLVEAGLIEWRETGHGVGGTRQAAHGEQPAGFNGGLRLKLTNAGIPLCDRLVLELALRLEPLIEAS
ncbi:MAG: radical SAM family heme chaperone HemW [Planctomycetota bacterium]